MMTRIRAPRSYPASPRTTASTRPRQIRAAVDQAQPRVRAGQLIMRATMTLA